ncbi:ADP/ATP-dependent (S)-NAD(P)H-hydrate dehydratase [uncultured Sphaerochaeta sp.]|uniref:ADP-dependent NAD(P)H-hydrate dehydratase n=1 Tax=uncultured Sphaerochaeta sp. TaxID=886478 RepID=UPI002A0A64C1|nr:ADP/ATP-dependent (S)-NAD(P)H-hydrate dehydratase [uncultured Sphaerochaeta sp.]
MPLVLDADALKAYATIFSENPGVIHGPLILTPHLGELRMLAQAVFGQEADSLGKNDSPQFYFSHLKKLSDILKATIVAKSSLVYVVSPNEPIMILEGLNPSLGVAGSGDVLSGIIVGLLGSGLESFKAALLGAAVHQKAGSLAKDALGYYDSEALLGFIGKSVGGMEV